MKVYTYPKTGDNIYCEVLENGLTVCVIPNNNYNSYYVSLGVKYGAIDRDFIPYGKDEYISTHAGVAHYLEHKNFTMEDGEDPFKFFSKNGASANASTGFLLTKYYIWGVENFEINFNYLLTYVFSPYFTDETVAKELGIINEEIRMYDDEPYWIIDSLAREMLFNELPIKDKLAGTYESISQITKEELYDCYNTFYVPNNMFLVVSGKVSEKDVFDIVKNHKLLMSQKPCYDIRRKKYSESDTVVEEYKEVKMNVFLPKVKYSFKINQEKFSLKDKLKLDMYFSMIESLIFGSSSEFLERSKKENVAVDYYVEHVSYNDYIILDFNAESDKSDIFKEMVDEYLKNIKINDEDLERMKRVWIASEIKISDNFELLAENLLDDYMIYNRLCYDRLDIIKTLNIEELNTVIKELDLSNSCFVIMNPKED